VAEIIMSVLCPVSLQAALPALHGGARSHGVVERLDMQVDFLPAAIDSDEDVSLHGGLSSHGLAQSRTQFQTQSRTGRGEDVDVRRSGGEFQILSGPFRRVHQAAFRIDHDIGGRERLDQLPVG
jgi:hypothetical protein